MSSTPPRARDTVSPAIARWTGELRAHEEPMVFFAVEGASRQACRTRTGPRGRLVFETELEGMVTEVLPDALRLRVDAHRVVVHHLLPRALDLSALAHRCLRIRIEQRYTGAGRATILAELRDEEDRVLLAAWDGRMPPDGDLLGLSLRSSFDAAAGSRIAIGGPRGVVSADVGATVGLELDGASFEARPLRLGPNDLCLVLLRR